MLKVINTITYAIDEDFDDIYKLYGKNTDLLGPPFPMAIREAIKKKEVLIVRDEDTKECLGFCNFHVLKRDSRITVYEIAVSESARGQGLGKRMIQFLEEVYKLPILAKCVKDSTAEAFWAKVATFQRYEQGKKRELAVYMTMKYYKEIKKRSLI